MKKTVFLVLAFISASVIFQNCSPSYNSTTTTAQSTGQDSLSPANANTTASYDGVYKSNSVRCFDPSSQNLIWSYITYQNVIKNEILTINGSSFSGQVLYENGQSIVLEGQINYNQGNIVFSGFKINFQSSTTSTYPYKWGFFVFPKNYYSDSITYIMSSEGINHFNSFNEVKQETNRDLYILFSETPSEILSSIPDGLVTNPKCYLYYQKL